MSRRPPELCGRVVQLPPIGLRRGGVALGEAQDAHAFRHDPLSACSTHAEISHLCSVFRVSRGRGPAPGGVARAGHRRLHDRAVSLGTRLGCRIPLTARYASAGRRVQLTLTIGGREARAHVRSALRCGDQRFGGGPTLSGSWGSGANAGRADRSKAPSVRRGRALGRSRIRPSRHGTRHTPAWRPPAS